MIIDLMVVFSASSPHSPLSSALKVTDDEVAAFGVSTVVLRYVRSLATAQAKK